MNQRKMLFALLCVMLAAVVVMTGVAVSRVSVLVRAMMQQPQSPSSAPQTSAVPTQSQPQTQPQTQPVTSPTQPLPTDPVPTDPVHEYVLSELVEPTCEGMGYSIYVCVHCEREDLRDFRDALGHDFAPGELHEPSCEASGFTRYACTRCDYIEDRAIRPASGHDLLFIETVTGTCIEAGYDLYLCQRCGAEIRENEVLATGHDFQPVGEAVLPSCTQDGVQKLLCSICGAESEELIPATGHAFGDWTVNPDGSMTCICAVCGDQQQTQAYEITGEQVSISSNDVRLYIIHVGTPEEPKAFYFMIWDYIDNGTLSYVLDPQRGLVVSYTDEQGVNREICRRLFDTAVIVITP